MSTFSCSALAMLYSSIYVCPSCREEIAPGVTNPDAIKAALAGVKLELVVWDDADWPGEDEPSLWVECARHQRILIRAPLGDRNLALIRETA